SGLRFQSCHPEQSCHWRTITQSKVFFTSTEPAGPSGNFSARNQCCRCKSHNFTWKEQLLRMAEHQSRQTLKVRYIWSPGMSDEELLSLCQRISTETNPTKLTKLLQELIQMLHQEQDSIKGAIAERLSNSATC